jgi:uncharacterized protein YegL
MLLAIAVVICSVLYSIVLSQPIPQTPPKVTLVGTVIGTNIIIEHRGGDDLSLDTKIILSINQPNQVYTFTAMQGLDDNSLNNGKWNVGEQFKHSLNNLTNYIYNENSKVAEVTIVDPDSNTIVMMGTLDIHPVSDIGVTITTLKHPPISKPFDITITVTNYRGDLKDITGVQIKCLLPDTLQEIKHTPADYDYNNVSGIWTINKPLEIHQSLSLTITAKIIYTENTITEPAQLGILLDGSNSISTTDWSNMTTGLSNAIKNPDIFPHDGSIELTIIQFGDPYPNGTTVVISPTIVNASNFQNITKIITNLKQGKGGTPMAAGIYRATDIMRNSKNFDSTKRQIITLVTDGKPTYYSNTDEYGGHGDGAVTDRIDLTTTENARNYTLTHLKMTGDKDEFDSLAVGSEPDVNWLKNEIVWPQPGTIANIPPYTPGWVKTIATWNEFEKAISEIFQVEFTRINDTVSVFAINVEDPNHSNDIANVTIYPQLNNTVDIPPNTPSSPTPANRTTNVLITTNLSWTGGDIDTGDTVTYDVYFGTTTTPTTKISSNQTATTYNPGTLASNTHYYWKIVAWDSYGETTTGPIWNFQTRTNHPPNTPNNPFPSNGATNRPLTQTLSWSGGDPDGDTVKYDVYFGITSTPTIKVSSNQTAITYNLGTLSSNTHYYWKIVAWDSYGATTTGPIWNFRT